MSRKSETYLASLMEQLVQLAPSFMEAKTTDPVICRGVDLIHQVMNSPAIAMELTAEDKWQSVCGSGFGQQVEPETLVFVLSNLATLTLASGKPRQGIVNVDEGLKAGAVAAAVPYSNTVLIALFDPPRWVRDEEVWLIQVMALLVGQKMKG